MSPTVQIDTNTATYEVWHYVMVVAVTVTVTVAMIMTAHFDNSHNFFPEKKKLPKSQ